MGLRKGIAVSTTGGSLASWVSVITKRKKMYVAANPPNDTSSTWGIVVVGKDFIRINFAVSHYLKTWQCFHAAQHLPC